MNLLKRLVDKYFGVREDDEPIAINLHGSAITANPSDMMDVDMLISICRAADAGDCERLFRLVAHISLSDADWIAATLQRQGPVVAKDWSLRSDKDATAETTAKRAWLKRQLRNVKGKRIAAMHMLSASVWPVAVVEKIMKPAPVNSPDLYQLVELRPVPFWRLTFLAGEHGSAGVLKLWVLDKNGQRTGRTEPITAERHIVHRGHLLQTLPDAWGGPARAVVYWWFFATLARQQWAVNLERTNEPKIVARYSRADEASSKRKLLAAFRRGVNANALIIPEDAKIEALSLLNSAAADSFDKFIALCQRQILKVVAVQTMTIQGQAGGLGGAQADVQSNALSGVNDFDETLLAETLTEQLTEPLAQANVIAGDVVSVMFGSDDAEAAGKADMLAQLKDAGLEVADSSLPKLSLDVGYDLQRAARGLPADAPRTIGLSAFAAETALRSALAAQAALVKSTAADLADAMSGDLEGIAAILRKAGTVEELTTSLDAFLAGFEPDAAADLLERALAAAALNGSFPEFPRAFWAGFPASPSFHAT